MGGGLRLDHLAGGAPQSTEGDEGGRTSRRQERGHRCEHTMTVGGHVTFGGRGSSHRWAHRARRSTEQCPNEAVVCRDGRWLCRPHDPLRGREA